MKKFKSFVSVLLMVVMIMSMTFAAQADETTKEEISYSITIENTASGHTYEAYQIFAGDLYDNILSNITWGSGISEQGQAALGDAAALAKTIEGISDASTYAEQFAEYLTVPAGTTSILNEGKYVISGLEPGYYLVKDKDGSLAGENDSYTSYILKVVKNVEVAPKSDVPSVEKKVKDTNDSTGETTEWQDSADYDIGDSVPFRLKATLAQNVEDYAVYKVVFHDTLSKGLTYEQITGVTVDGNPVESGYSVDTKTNEDRSTALTITFENIKEQGAVNGSIVTIEYTAKLNDEAVLGSIGNPNVVYLEYSNNPNWKPEYVDDDNNPETPDVPKNPEDTPTGNTPEDKVIVFTYKVVVNKVDQDGKELQGAGFTLYKWEVVTPAIEDDPETAEVDETAEAVYDWVAIGEEVKPADNNIFAWKGIDDGKYKLVETTTPAGYNTIDPIEFEVTAEHDVTADDPKLTALTGGNLFTGDVVTGQLTSTVKNQIGATLPSTGGMGTTIIYVAGGILVAAAVVLLIAKKRMANNI